MLRFRSGSRAFNYRPRLKISERFHSLQGEGSHAGLPCTFIRLTGCALRCRWCDSEYAFYGGRWQTFDELLTYARAMASPLVQITGGEPLHQPAVWPFVDLLVAAGFRPLIETSGAVDIGDLNSKAHILMDIKTPGSGESARNLWSNLDLLKASDEVKFVVDSMADLEWSLAKIRDLELAARFGVLISPVAGIAGLAALAEAVRDSGLPIRFQLQLHKLI